MLSAFISLIYVQISPERLTLKDPKTGQTLSEVPELANAAGASKVNVWTGRPLTDEELLTRKPPAQGGVWE